MSDTTGWSHDDRCERRGADIDPYFCGCLTRHMERKTAELRADPMVLAAATKLARTSNLPGWLSLHALGRDGVDSGVGFNDVTFVAVSHG